MKTLVVNLFGGPGIGKSTNAARLFSMLKDEGIETELVVEYAKELVWSDNLKALSNQLHVFSAQNDRIARLQGKVQVVVTDSPLHLSLYYGKDQTETFKALVREVSSSYQNVNVLLTRVKPYSENGRLQTLEESTSIDAYLRDTVLPSLNEEMIEAEGSKEGAEYLLGEIMNKIKGA